MKINTLKSKTELLVISRLIKIATTKNVTKPYIYTWVANRVVMLKRSINVMCTTIIGLSLLYFVPYIDLHVVTYAAIVMVWVGYFWPVERCMYSTLIDKLYES